VSGGWLPLLAALGVAALPEGGDVDLAKSMHVHGGAEWAGRRIGEVLDADAIARVILLKAVTSTTADRDLAGIRRLLRDAADQPFLAAGPPPALLRLGHEDSTWEAVLLARDGAVFGFTASGDRACLRAADGQGGCFAMPRPGVD
jgi:hypothetical protein